MNFVTQNENSISRTHRFFLVLLFLTWFAKPINAEVLPVEDEESFLEAIGNAEPGDIIQLNVERLRLNQTMNFTVPSILHGGGRNSLTEILCPEDGSALRINANATIRNISFTGCRFPAVDISSQEEAVMEVNFRNCEFRANQLMNDERIIRGAGIRIQCERNCHTERTRLRVADCRFYENVADRGAGIFALNAELFVTDSVFVNNTGDFGGSAIYSTQSFANSSAGTFVYINNSRFEDNRASRVGLANDLRDLNGKPLEIVTYYTFTAPLATGGACLFENVQNTTIEFSNFGGNEAAAGGAVSYIYDGMRAPESDILPAFHINNCTFTNNSAKHDNSFYERTREVRLGGALHIALNIDQVAMRIFGTKFYNNEAHHGGAIHLVASNAVEAQIEECVFEGNYANITGGAVTLRYIGQLNWYSTNATRNIARQGGAIMLTNQAGFHVRGLSVNRDGDTAGVPSVFTQNAALDGGAIMCAGCGPVDIQHPELLANNARRLGGAVYVLECIHNFRIQHVTANNNIALVGGAFAAESSELFSLVTDGVLRGHITNNTAVMGGALYYSANRQRTNTVFLRGQIFENNSAVLLKSLNETLVDIERSVRRLDPSEHLGDIGEERLEACSQGGGGAVCIGLTGAPVRSSFDVILEVSNFTNNRAYVGGGVYISIDAASWNTENVRRCSLTTSHLEACRGITFRDVWIRDNVATEGGGGAFVSDPENVYCTCDKENVNNATLKDVINTYLRKEDRDLDVDPRSDLYCTRFEGNSVLEHDGNYGPRVATRAFSLSFESPKTPFTGINSGDRLQLPPDSENATKYVILVKDAFDQRITGGRPEAKLEVNVESILTTGQSRYSATNGSIVIDATSVILQGAEMPNDTEPREITFSAVRNSELSLKANFTFRKCRPGEMWTNATCAECAINFFSFAAGNPRCYSCLENAVCTGGAVLIPDEGYWHATPFSPRFHKCIVDDACKYDGRKDNLSAFYNSTNLQLSMDVPNNSEYQQCRDGYQSRLCASCANNYGRLSDGECVSCDSRKALTIVLIIILTFWIGILVAIEIFNTLQTNHEFKELKQIRETRSFNSAIIPMGNCGPLPGQAADSPIQSFSGRFYRDYGMNPGPSRVPEEPSIVITDNVPPHIASSEKLTELIKILINFMQITSVAVSMNLKWQSGIKYILRTHELLTGVTHGTSYLPLECTFEQRSVRASIAVLWIRVSFPFIILGGFLLLGTMYWFAVPLLKKRRNQRNYTAPFGDLTTYYIVTIIAVSFFAYKDVTEELMRTLNCIKIDERGDESTDQASEEDPTEVYKEYAIATSLYWGEDTSLVCFKGNHLATGIFGVLGLTVFSLGAVFFNALFLLKNFHMIDKEKFIARYGFLYRSYRPLWYTVPWESVISIRKALVSAAVVYAFRLGRNLQAVMALGVLILAQAAHLICRPFKDYKTCPSLPEYAGHRSCFPFPEQFQRTWRKLNDRITLNYLESASLLTSTITFYSGIVFNDDQTSDAGIIVMTIFAAAVNVLFFGYMLYRLYYAFHVMVNEMSSYIEQTCDPASGFVYIKGPGIIALLKRTSRLIQYKYRQYVSRPRVDTERSALRIAPEG
eukprot:g2099.t1